MIGVAAGISDGLGFGDNAKSALLARGLVEMTRFGTAFGADARTFAGLAGLGDLITTCASRHGRNRRVGERIGQGERPDAVLGGMTMVFVARRASTRLIACTNAYANGRGYADYSRGL